jgi:uncharacterized membrane protein
MATHEPPEPQRAGSAEVPVDKTVTAFSQMSQTIRNRFLEGLFVLLPILVTFWVIRWLYSNLEYYVIDPIAVLVIWKVQQLQRAPELPYWFETYFAPAIAIVLALLIVYCCGVLAHTQLRRGFDEAVLRVPLVSHVYDAVRQVLQGFNKPKAQANPSRVVLVAFPHPGMRLPAIVTSTCQDVATDRKLLCVYVPTTPIPTSGFFLIVPEDDVTELNWDVQQTLQAIISGGLTAPSHVTYYTGQTAPVVPPLVSPGGNPLASPDGSGRS